MALVHDTVDRYGFARSHPYPITDLYLFQREFAFVAVANHLCGGRHQVE